MSGLLNFGGIRHRFRISASYALVCFDIVQMLASPASPLITIQIIADFDSSFFWHSVLLFLLFDFNLHLRFVLRPEELGSIPISTCLPGHSQLCNAMNATYYAISNNQFEVMLNPIKNLAGKLNHLHLPQTRYLRVIELANSIRPRTASNSFKQATVDQIRALKSNTDQLDERTYHKFQFDLQVQTEAAIFNNPSTIFDILSPHERKISHHIATYASKLNHRQQLYLNLAFRKKLNNEFPGWNTLHLSAESPSKVDLEIIPTLSATSRISELKSLPKIKVMKEVIKAKQAV